MNELKVERWEGFRKLIDETLRGMQREQERTNGGRHLAGALFRGVGNSDWGLETTLERSIDAAHTETLASYHQKIDRSKQITATGAEQIWVQSGKFMGSVALEAARWAGCV